MANPKGASKFGWAVIHVAAENGNVTLAKMLLNRGVETDTRTRYGETPLHIALQKGHVSVAEYFLESGADPVAQNCKGVSPLHLLAGFRTNQNLIRKFLRKDLDVNLRDENQARPIHWAAKANNVVGE